MKRLKFGINNYLELIEIKSYKYATGMISLYFFYDHRDFNFFLTITFRAILQQ